ncbi:deoxynucleoside kinase [Piscinibacter sakaiensis]|uniref:deoxynucleoside kinase n=1 Tax=Piscinibacter sakaiensis TaxID=1547922 RepID=UPI003AAD93B7
MVAQVTSSNFRRVRKDRVEILGVFGAGKTTLAHRLAENQRLVLAENYERNIFWNDQQAINALGYLPCDLSFLLQHAHLVARAAVTGSECLFCDWSLLSDRLWASMRLGQEFAAYETVHRAVSDRIGQPLGYLYLKQPAEVIAARLVKRGRSAESAFSAQAAPRAADQLEALVRSLPPERVLTVGEDVPLKYVRTWTARRRESAGLA